MTSEPREEHHDAHATRPSMFLRLADGDLATQARAWQEFHDRYAPILAAFARHCGASASDLDDIVQEVILAFYKAFPKFKYDPSLGRFRGYLKTITVRAVHKKLHGRARLAEVLLGGLPDDAPQIEQAWEEDWQRLTLARAVEELRVEHENSETFRAFERYVMAGQAPQQVATELALSIDSVYQAKTRLTRRLREKVAQLRAGLA